VNLNHFCLGLRPAFNDPTSRISSVGLGHLNVRGRFHRFDDVQKMATQFRVKYDESLFAPLTYNAPPQT
jgi:hypothetical protein